MVPKIVFAKIQANEIIYRHDTGLFPFSPRKSVDRLLVAGLKRSIAETGIWQPIVVRAKTLEGIAGNHRFLAMLEIARERGVGNGDAQIPTMLVDCDEGLAVTIALSENEFRRDLTQWETVHALLHATDKMPKVAERVFDVDGVTADQMRLWTNDEIETIKPTAPQGINRPYLTREWLATINERLADYPDLRDQFLSQLRYPTWIQAQSLEELNRAITRALLKHGVQFVAGETWNAAPTSKCFGHKMDLEQYTSKVQQGDAALLPSPDGTVESFCPHLRLMIQHTSQFTPNPQGEERIAVSADAAYYPPETISHNGKSVRGTTSQMITRIEAYCIDPTVRRTNSCFAQREAEAAENLVADLRAKKLPAVLPAKVKEHEQANEFIWQEPKREGIPCSPENCVYANDEIPGFELIVQPTGQCKMGCVHAECGGAAKESLIDWEERKRKLEAQKLQAAIDELRRVTIERTLLAPQGKALDLYNPQILEALEKILVPQWDTTTMNHVVIGWQLEMRARIAAEVEHENADDKRVAETFKERHEFLAKEVTDENAFELFSALRSNLIRCDDDLPKWITCLTLVRSWRDDVKVVE